MPARTLDIDGTRWTVQPSGHVTQYDADEFGVIFVRQSGSGRELRITRYRPPATRSREQSFADCTDADLRALFASSQSSENSPEGGYAG
jgi:hypothetical protein